jgi:hypothetical protein
MTVFLTVDLVVILTLANLYPNEDVVFGILKASHFQYDSFLRERAGVRLKMGMS